MFRYRTSAQNALDLHEIKKKGKEEMDEEHGSWRLIGANRREWIIHPLLRRLSHNHNHVINKYEAWVLNQRVFMSITDNKQRPKEFMMRLLCLEAMRHVSMFNREANRKVTLGREGWEPTLLKISSYVFTHAYRCTANRRYALTPKTNSNLMQNNKYKKLTSNTY